MTSGILLAVLLAIVALGVVRGSRGYRALVAADETARGAIFRRILIMQLLLYTLPSIIGLLVLGRIDALAALPGELWDASSLVTAGDPAIEPNMVMIRVFAGAMLFAMPLGAALTWRRTRQGKGIPRSIAHIAALLPRNRDEVILGTAISFAAGIGEEMFFRLLLPMLLAAFIDPIAAVAVAILLFGIGHSYQGWKGVLVTSLVGAGLAFIYLTTGSLLVPILLHITIDLMTLAVRPVIRGAWRVRAA